MHNGEHRLSLLSINEDEFNKAKSLYEKVLKGSGFSKNLKFECIQEKPLRNRKRKVLWFKLKYNAEAKTNTVVLRSLWLFLNTFNSVFSLLITRCIVM